MIPLSPDRKDATPIWRDVWTALWMFLATRPVLFLIAYYANLRVEKFKYYQKLGHWLDPVMQWDAHWYLSIIRDGYSYTAGEPSNVAFFPMYPILVRFVTLLFRDPVFSGFVVSNICLVLAAASLMRLVRLEFGSSTLARRSAFYLMIFPTGIFFSLYYVESLFMLLSVLAWYHARKGKWLHSALFGAMLTATKSFGVATMIPVLVEVWQAGRRDGVRTAPLVARMIGHAVLFCSGIITYACFLHWKFGDALAFIRVQDTWGRTDKTYAGTIGKFVLYSPFEQILYVGSLSAVILAAVALVWRKANWTYALYAVLLLLLVLKSGSLDSIQRYSTLVLTTFMGWGVISRIDRRVDTFLTTVFISLAALFMMLYASGYRFY